MKLIALASVLAALTGNAVHGIEYDRKDKMIEFLLDDVANTCNSAIKEGWGAASNFGVLSTVKLGRRI